MPFFARLIKEYRKRVSSYLLENPGAFTDASDEDTDSEGMMLPPWLKYPNIPLGSIGWRMGNGEEYWDRYRQWYLNQRRSVRKQVTVKYPEPSSWAGFFLRLKE